MRKWDIELDTDTIPFVASQQVVALIEQLAKTPENIEIMKNLQRLLRQLQQLPVKLDFWEAQNIYFDIGKLLYEDMSDKAEEDETAANWVRNFSKLGDYLDVKFE